MDKIDIITDPEAHRTRILSSRRFGGLREGMQTVPLCVCVFFLPWRFVCL